MNNRELIQSLREEVLFFRSQMAGLKFEDGTCVFRTSVSLEFVLAAADAWLAEPEWTRVEDALPVVPVGDVTVPVYLWWRDGGKSVSRYRAYADDKVVKSASHWCYAEPTPPPPEQQP